MLNRRNALSASSIFGSSVHLDNWNEIEKKKKRAQWSRRGTERFDVDISHPEDTLQVSRTRKWVVRR